MEKEIYQGNYLRVTELQVGGDLYEKAYLRGAVIIFPIDQDGKIIILKEERPHEPNNSVRLKPVTGFLDDGLSWEENTQKELQEEIGFKASNLELFHHLDHTGNFNVEKYFVLAKGLVPSKIHNADDQDRILEHFSIGLDEFVDKTISGDIFLNFDSLGVFILAYKVANGHIRLT